MSRTPTVCSGICILAHGFITTEELKDQYGYNHPPRAARDVREQGIPLETFRVTGSDGRKIGAYRFGDPAKARYSRLSSRTAFAKKLKAALIELQGSRCAIYLEEFDPAELQIDHRVPYATCTWASRSWEDPNLMAQGSPIRCCTCGDMICSEKP